MKLRPLPQLPKRTWAGFGCIYAAGLGWLTSLIVPFTSLHNKVLVVIIALGFAELMFFIGVTLLGKEYYKQIKAKLLEYLKGNNRP